MIRVGTPAVWRQAGRVQVGDMLLNRDRTLPPMAAFFSEPLVLEMDGCDAGFDIAARQFERVQRAAKAGLGIGDQANQSISPSPSSVGSDRSAAAYG